MSSSRKTSKAGPTTALRREIKRTFVPFLAERGFVAEKQRIPSFLCFRKIAPDAVLVCEVQWEKYGTPRFVVNFGKCSPNGVVLRGSYISADKVTVAQTPLHGRLHPGKASTTRGWFRQDRSFLEQFRTRSRLRPPEAVVAELVSLFAEVEEFWQLGRIGPHIRLTRVPDTLRAADAL